MGSDVVPDWGQACNSTVYRIVWRSVKHFFRFPANFFVKRFSTFSPFCRGKLFCHKILWPCFDHATTAVQGLFLCIINYIIEIWTHSVFCGILT